MLQIHAFSLTLAALAVGTIAGLIVAPLIPIILN